VIAVTEQQFNNCLQQIKTLGEEKEQRQKELEDLRGPPNSLLTWWIRRKAAKQMGDPYWSDSSEHCRKSSVSSPKPPSHVSATP
jgi:hypothetical protein